METKGREGGRGGLPCPAARSTAARVRRLGCSRRAYAERCLRGGGKMRLSLTRDERTEAVVRIVRRRQRASMRVREERRRTPPDRAAARCRSRLRRNPPKTADTPVQRLSRPMRQGGSDSPRRSPHTARITPSVRGPRLTFTSWPWKQDRGACSLPAHPHQRVDHADTIGQDEQWIDLDLHDIVVFPTEVRGEPG